MSNFLKYVKQVLNTEGGYSNDPTDPGGETNHGITFETARMNGYTGAMKDMTEAQALDIYKKAFWDVNRLDEISSEELQLEIFDSGVNCGVTVPVRWLQTILNSLNNKATRWPDIEVDGALGPGTLKILNAALADRVLSTIIFNAMNAFQTVHYITISQGNKDLEKYVYGWISQRVRFSTVSMK